MKRLIRILAIAAPVFAVLGCYDPYVVDYDQSAVYVAYQYDLRSLVVGESMKFDFGAVLGGVISNNQDRAVRFEVSDQLVNGDLSSFGGDAPFTALDGMKGTAPVGALTQSYVTDEVTAAGLESLTPLPASCYKLSDSGKMTIKAGNHTATVTLTADQAALLADEHAGPKPYYAIGWKIVSADADTVLLSKSFGVIAVKLENMFFGYWYHGGKSTVTTADGKTTENAYPTRIPADANTHEVYTLKTLSPYSLEVNRFHNDLAGKMIITAKDGAVSVSSEDGSITDTGSGWNNAKLLQDRKIFLNYKYTSADGSTTVVSDTLTFRNRIRDGINEWQDEDPTHYAK
ncbi:MAG: DUF1735 domain-containing protein [Bacteroidales bacterium]|nr:DUF1735 domain-containing protein [Bacteroidales bacterium]